MDNTTVILNEDIVCDEPFDDALKKIVFVEWMIEKSCKRAWV